MDEMLPRRMHILSDERLVCDVSLELLLLQEMLLQNSIEQCSHRIQRELWNLILAASLSTPSLLVLVLVHHQFSSNVLSFFSSSSFFDSFFSPVILLLMLMLQKQRDIVYLHGQQQIERNNDGRDASRHNLFKRHGILTFVSSDK